MVWPGETATPQDAEEKEFLQAPFSHDAQLSEVDSLT